MKRPYLWMVINDECSIYNEGAIMNITKLLSVFLTLSLFTSQAWSEEKKDGAVKMEKTPTGLKLLFPDGFASTRLTMMYENGDDKSRSIGDNAYYDYRLYVGTKFLEGKWTSYLRGLLSKGVHSREVTIGSTLFFNSLSIWNNDYVSTSASLETYFPTSKTATRTTNYLYSSASANYPVDTQAGKFVPSLYMNAKTIIKSTKSFKEVAAEKDSTKASLVDEKPKLVEIKPKDLILESGLNIGYTTEKIKGFSTDFSYQWNNSTDAAGEKSSNHEFANYTTYKLSDKWGLHSYTNLASDTKGQFNGFDVGKGGLYQEMAVKYYF